MKINLKIWECAQRLIELRYEGLDCGYDDTSDVYDWLIADIHPNQVDNFHAMICRDVHPVNLNDCFIDDKYNTYRVILCDVEKDKIQIRVNGSQYMYDETLTDGAEFILNTCKLVKPDEYFHYLDIVWEAKHGTFMGEKLIERVDFKPEDKNFTI